MLEIQLGGGDLQSLSHHEKLARKEAMEKVLSPLNESLSQIRELGDKLRSPTHDDEAEWTVATPETSTIHPITEKLTQQTLDLDNLFRDMGTLVLANLEDRLKNILQETKERKRSHSLLHSWDELELELADGHDVRVDDVRSHRASIESFIKFSIEEHESSRRGSVTFSNCETLQESLNSRIPSAASPRADGSISELGHSRSSLTGSVPSDTPWTGEGLSNKPKRASVLFVDYNNEGKNYRQNFVTFACLGHLLGLPFSIN